MSLQAKSVIRGPHLHRAPLRNCLGVARSAPTDSHLVPRSHADVKRSEISRVLDRAQEDLAQFCALTSDVEGWEAHAYFVDKRTRLEEHCDLEFDEGEHDAASCAALCALEQLTREQVAAGSVREFRNNLVILRRAEARLARQQAVANGLGVVAQTATSSGETEAERAAALHDQVKIIQLFRELDANGDGQLTMCELQLGMEKVGAVLTAVDLEAISDAFVDPKRGIDLDSFLSIAGVGGGSAPCASVTHGLADDGNFLRHATHVHGHH